MLHVTKGTISLQVSIQGGRVSVTPAAGMDAHSRLPAVFAGNEELLAQTGLNPGSTVDAEQQLINYFTQRGWTVQVCIPVDRPIFNRSGQPFRPVGAMEERLLYGLPTPPLALYRFMSFLVALSKE